MIKKKIYYDKFIELNARQIIKMNLSEDDKINMAFKVAHNHCTDNYLIESDNENEFACALMRRNSILTDIMKTISLLQL